MSISIHIAVSLELPSFVVNEYLKDLSDEDLMVRPQEKMNHIAWQLGHLVASEHEHINQLAADSMPDLPNGFAAMHCKDTATSDDPSRFLSRAEYLGLMNEQRQGTLKILHSFSDERLQQPSPESIRYLGPTVGAVFSGESTHWMMHAGQWAVVRRKLGKPPLF